MAEIISTNGASKREAKEAGLHYTSDADPGITRVRKGARFLYLQHGKRVRDKKTLARIRALAIPPAWEHVWVCASGSGHLQATGRDARGRKQYRYHPRWRQHRDETKFHRMINFGLALPSMRRRLRRDLKLPGMPREKVLATVTRLLETSLIRVGNEEYARENHSYGLTTLRNRHATVSGVHLQFHFRGKSGKTHLITLQDPLLAKVVRRCQDMPGQELFSYENGDGAHKVTSEDVNRYIREISGEDFTAKDFRTWGGTTLAALALNTLGPSTHETQAKKNVQEAVKSVAQILGNTPAVCRNCYIHPAVVDSYLAGAILSISRPRTARKLVSRFVTTLQPPEAAVLELLKLWVKRKTASGQRRQADLGARP